MHNIRVRNNIIVSAFGLFIIIIGPFLYHPILASIQAGLPVLSRTGNTNTYVTATGSFTNGNCLQTDSNHNAVDNGAPCAGSAGGIITYSGPSLTLTGTLFFPIGGGGASSATETNVDVEAPTASTVTNMFVQLNATTSAGTLIVTFRKNAADTALTCTITNPATTCNDITHSFSAAQGDLIDIKAVASNSTVAATIVIATQFGTIGLGKINSGTNLHIPYYNTTGSTLSADPNFTTDGAGNINVVSCTGCGGGGSTVTFTQPYVTDSTNFFFPAYQITKPLDTTWINQNSATRSVTNGAVFISLPTTNSGTDNITCRVLTNAIATYTLTVGVITSFISSTSGSSFWVVAGDSGSGKLVLNGQSGFGANTTFTSYIAHAASPTTNLTSVQNLTTWQSFGPTWYRIKDDGTNITYSVSRDGINFIQLFQESDTVFLPSTPANQLGFCLENLSQAQSINYGATVFHLGVTNP